MKKNITHLLSESGICIALATILSLLTLYRWPYGGSVTVASMLPICLFAYRRGIKAGLACGFVHGMIQLFLGITEGVFKGADLMTTVGMVAMDYLLAFTVLGLAGMFKDRIKNDSVAFMTGSLVATFIRFISHILSGYIFFKSYAEWFFSQEGFTAGNAVLENVSGEPLYWLYTLVYNASYMIPEILVTSIAALIIGKYAKLVRVAK